MKLRLLNVSIRMLVLISRFIFLFYIAKFLEPAEVGLYGLFVASVLYTLYFLGLDFYTYTTREIAGASREVWGGYIKNQAFFSLLMYVVFIPLSIVIFLFDILPWSLLVYFLFILVLEHICLEFIRFFIAASEQISSTIVLFLNQGGWALILIVLMSLDVSYKNIESIFIFWIFGSLLAIIFSAYKLSKMNISGWGNKPDFEWIKKGLFIAIPLLIGTLAYRGVFTFDRILINYTSSLEIVAVYVLFIGVAGVLLALLDAAVFSFAYPKLISCFKNNLKDEYYRIFNRVLSLTILLSLGYWFLSYIFLPVLVAWIGRESYFEYCHVFYWLLIAMTINGFWMVFHNGLYSQGMDKHIVWSHVLSLVVFVFLFFILNIFFEYQSILISLIISQLVILAWKCIAFYRFSKINMI